MGEPGPIGRRVRLSNEIPKSLRAAFERARDAGRAVVVVKCEAKACAVCAATEPSWGDCVFPTSIDLDTAPEATVFLAPEAVPEWVCFDRRGVELGRWRGRIDQKD